MERDCGIAVEKWFLVPEEEKSKTLNELMKLWSMPLLLESVFEKYSDKQYVLARHAKECEVLKTTCLESKKIGLYYYKYGKGGVERVLSYLLSMYIQMGYEVILITDEKEEDGDYELPDHVKRYVIPGETSICTRKQRYGQRAFQLIDILKKENVDTLCYHAASSRIILYDLIAVKSLGIKFVIVKHEMFSQGMTNNRDFITNEIHAYPLADLLVVLSQEEELFWKTLGVKSFLIPNPIEKSCETDYRYNEKSNNIVWVGRLNRNQKRYQDIIPIMLEVKRSIPDCILNIYGNDEGNGDKELLERQIKEHGLENQIKYLGYCTDVKKIYDDAGVLLVTSAFESFSMIILESKQLGIPLVTYAMPYLELLKNGKGFIEIEQGDTFMVAQALIKVLADVELRRRLSQEAKESIANYSNDELIEKWKKVFSSDGEQSAAIDHNETGELYKRIIKTMVFHHSLGCQRYHTLEKRYRTMRLEYKMMQIKDICKSRGKYLAIYPYGAVGRKIKERLEEEGMKVSLIIDNKLSGRMDGIISVEDLNRVNIENMLIIICSNRFEIYEEIRSTIYEAVPKENTFDLFPLEEIII